LHVAVKVLAALDGGAAAAGLSLPQPLVAPPSDGWVVIRLGAYRAESSAEVDELSRFISRLKPFCRKARKKQQL
jgi:hypothetical protein